jgi:DNA-binding beta-propeller fold protein YncE
MRILGVAIVAIVAGGLTLVSGMEAKAQREERWRRRVVVTGLERPTGIARDGNELYITQLPTPGVAGSAGGRNLVSRIDRRGRVADLVVGEPEPTNLSVDLLGTVRWTCRSAGVIVELLSDDGDVEVLRAGLRQPTGIATCLFGFDVYFTELPTPGVPGSAGGMNTVRVFNPDHDDEPELVDLGDPEPTDLAVDLDGTVYWTCSSAGVIVMFRDGVESVILAGLERPTGLAIDLEGNLYWTELPTPGVPGAKGGRNAVKTLDEQTGRVTVIAQGDPEPADVTVDLWGDTVSWTDSTLGAVFSAKRVGRGRR